MTRPSEATADRKKVEARRGATAGKGIRERWGMYRAGVASREESCIPSGSSTASVSYGGMVASQVIE